MSTTATPLADNSPMPFGKYKGTALINVPTQYLKVGDFAMVVGGCLLEMWTIVEVEAVYYVEENDQTPYLCMSSLSGWPCWLGPSDLIPLNIQL